MPQPSLALTKCTERIGFGPSPSAFQVFPPSVVPSTVRTPTTHPVLPLMKSTPTNCSVEASCFAQWVPSFVAKTAYAPTAQPRRGPTIWIDAKAGTKSGSMPEGDGDADVPGVVVLIAVADAVAIDAEALGLGDGVALTAVVAVQPLSVASTAIVETAARRPGRDRPGMHIRRARRSRHATRAGWRPWGRSTANCKNAR